MDCKKTGELIKKLRIEKKMTQKDLAEKLNITDRAISKWERGLGAPDISLLKEISEILGVSINEILVGERIKENMDNMTYESINLNKEKTPKQKIGLTIIASLLILTTFLINYSFITLNLRLDYICIIYAFLFLSLIIHLKTSNNQTLKKKFVLLFTIFYITSIVTYIFYTGIMYQQNNLIDIRNGIEIVPFLPIINKISMTLNGTQTIWSLFDYVIVDFCMLIPCSLCIPYLYQKHFSLKKYFLIMLILIIGKEIIQLITNQGVFDINDIILNFFGVVVSYYFFKKLKLFYIISKR